MSIKGWMTGKGAQFKKTFRVDKGSGRTSSSSGAKKGNIFVGAKLVEVCDYQNARATVEIIFESALCRTLLENVGWKTMINAAEKIQACHRGGHVRKHLRKLHAEVDESFKPDDDADAMHKTLVEKFRCARVLSQLNKIGHIAANARELVGQPHPPLRSSNSRLTLTLARARALTLALALALTLALTLTLTLTLTLSLTLTRAANQEVPPVAPAADLASMLPSPSQASMPVNTPAAYDADSQLQPPPAPDTVARIMRGSPKSVVELPMIEDLTKTANGEWRDRNGKVLLSPLLVGHALENDAWPEENKETPIRLRVLHRRSHHPSPIPNPNPNPNPNPSPNPNPNPILTFALPSNQLPPAPRRVAPAAQALSRAREAGGL